MPALRPDAAVDAAGDGDALGEARNRNAVFPERRTSGGRGILELGEDVHRENQSTDHLGADQGDRLGWIGDREARAHES